MIIKEKADALFWAGTMRRIGLCVYNTFVFLHDNYRILTIYPDVKKYLTKLPADAWRDVEMKYAKSVHRRGKSMQKSSRILQKKIRACLRQSLGRANA